MQVILKEDYQGLGYVNDIIDVKPGFARNFLIPRGIAIYATPAAIKVRNEVVKQQAHKVAKKIESASELAEALNAVTVVVPVKATDEGKIFGSVTPAIISEILLNNFKYEVDKKYIQLKDDRIKELGSYEAEVNLYKDVVATLKIEVIDENKKDKPIEEKVEEVVEKVIEIVENEEEK
ncbi:MAG: 50S ribosomal protein L9 [Bacteroidales bacterium]|jgi:large subunit ribosomal protein L9